MTRTYTTKNVNTVERARRVLQIMKANYTIAKNDNGYYVVSFTCDEHAKRYIDEAFKSSYIY